MLSQSWNAKKFLKENYCSLVHNNVKGQCIRSTMSKTLAYGNQAIENLGNFLDKVKQQNNQEGKVIAKDIEND